MSNVSDVVTNTKSDKSIKAKAHLETFVSIINKKLEEYFDNEIDHAFGVSDKEQTLSYHMLNHIKEHNLRPAKRLRGSFIYYAYKMFGGKDEESILEAAMSIELVHTALLMHDDFMDQDNTRRGKPTSHEYFKEDHEENHFKGDAKHYGESMAVTVGDTALCLGYEILAKSNFSPDKKIDALTRLLRGITNTTYGQAYDVTLESMGKASEGDIIDVHRAKTGIYTYENPLHIGAILAGAKDDDLKILTKYAEAGGVAFQLQDDILGLFGSPEKTGKPAHSDLRQGKMTLLIIKAFEKANEEQKNILNRLWGKRDLTDKEAGEARKIVIDTGSLDYSKKISVKWAKQAQRAIPLMREKGWDNEGIDYLDGIAQYMVEREM
jgi:geranylgeranyl diphosphate synthase, type I